MGKTHQKCSYKPSDGNNFPFAIVLDVSSTVLQGGMWRKRERKAYNIVEEAAKTKVVVQEVKY